MNRLREGTGDDQVAAWGITLLRETPPAPAMDLLKRQVWISLNQTNDSPWVKSRVPAKGMPTRIRMFTLVVLFSVVAGSAGAMVLGRWISPRHEQSMRSSARDAETGTGVARQRATRPRTSAQQASAPQASAPQASAPLTSGQLKSGPPKSDLAIADSGLARAPLELQQPQVPEAPLLVAGPTGATTHRAGNGGAARSVKSRRAANPDSPADISREAAPVSGPAAQVERTEVLDAMVALRRHHDPVLAGVLLDRYLAAHPQGALHEEALALAIEAAVSRGDRASSHSLARTYQARYPQGRFLAFARSQAN